MSEQERTRIRRTLDERTAELDTKITYHKDCIAKLKERKTALQKPPKARVRKTSMAKAIATLKEAGLTPDQILAMATKAAKK